MPNTGKPSQDCHLCRLRRVKCDLARPACQRCIKYGADCPGYRDKSDLMFRNTYAAKASAGSRASSRSLEGCKSGSFTVCTAALPTLDSHRSSSADSPSVSRQAQRRRHDALPAPSPSQTPFAIHWTTHSIPLVINFFSAMRFLPPILAKVPENHPLVLVSHIFARTYMLNQHNAPRDKREVSAYLGRALQGIQATINDASKCREDATIAAVWLLGNYEILVGGIQQPGSGSNAWLVHSAGLTSLLRNRGPHGLDDPTVRHMFWTAYGTIQIQSMISNTRCPAELNTWLDSIEKYVTPEEEQLLTIVRFISAGCALFEVAVPLIVDAKFAEISEIYSSFVKKLEEAEVLSPHISPRPGDINRQTFWTSWCGFRIKLNYFTILASGMLEHTPNSPYSHETLAWQRRACRENTARMSGDIIKSLPVSLGGYAVDTDMSSPSTSHVGLRLIWPLSVISMIPTVPSQDRVAARGALLKIGRDLGILQALRGYSAQKKYPREALSKITVDKSVPTDGCLPEICSSHGLGSSLKVRASQT